MNYRGFAFVYFFRGNHGDGGHNYYIRPMESCSPRWLPSSWSLIAMVTMNLQNLDTHFAMEKCIYN